MPEVKIEPTSSTREIGRKLCAPGSLLCLSHEHRHLIMKRWVLQAFGLQGAQRLETTGYGNFSKNYEVPTSQSSARPHLWDPLCFSVDQPFRGGIFQTMFNNSLHLTGFINTHPTLNTDICDLYICKGLLCLDQTLNDNMVPQYFSPASQSKRDEQSIPLKAS